MKLLYEYDLTKPERIIKFIRKTYLSRKTYFFENYSENNCFKVLRTADILKNNVEYFTNYFFSEIDRMDIDLEDNIENSIYLN